MEKAITHAKALGHEIQEKLFGKVEYLWCTWSVEGLKDV